MQTRAQWPSRRSIARFLAAVLAASSSRAATAAPPTAESRPKAGFERVEVEDADGRRTVEGTVVVEAVDGGLLVERLDQRLELLQPDVIRGRAAADDVAKDAARDVGRRLLSELPPGFDLLVTRHYCVCHDTSRAYAQWCAGLFERLHGAFSNCWSQAGIDVVEPAHPLVVVIFADRRRYEEFAARDLGAAADRVAGYYNLLTNRVTTYDITGSAAAPRPAGQSASRAGLDILSSPQAAGLVSTLVHEATHQMAFNCGLQRRLAPVPVWVSEGVATYFETPDLSSQRGWRGIGSLNGPRLERFLGRPEPGFLERMVVDDQVFREAEGAVDAYARAWAVTFFLMQTKRDAFVGYLRTIASKEPLTADSPETRLRDFEEAFGTAPAALEEPLLRFLTRQRRPPSR
jgi:hypothetical protein